MDEVLEEPSIGAVCRRWLGQCPSSFRERAEANDRNRFSEIRIDQSEYCRVDSGTTQDSSGDRFCTLPFRSLVASCLATKVAELELSRVADTAANVFRDPVTKAELSVSARIGAFQKLLQYDRALAPGLLDKLLKDSDPDIQALAWRTIAWDKVGMQPTDMKRWQDWVESGPSNAPSSPWSALFGATALQARLECTGLRRWPITEAMRKTFEESPFATARELRHAWLWAISRQQRSGTATKKFYSTLDEAAGALLYGTPPTKVDSATMDAVAKSSNARTIGKSIDQQLEAIQLILAALGDMRHFVGASTKHPESHHL